MPSLKLPSECSMLGGGPPSGPASVNGRSENTMTEVYQLSTESIDDKPILRAAEVLHCGGLVAFPTETVYGLGANALDAAAVGRIFAAKGRPPNNPVIVHVASVAQARELAAEWPGAAARLAARFWPGPLTLVLPKQAVIPDLITAGAATVGLRIPAHPIARALIAAAGIPVAAPSANRSNLISPTTAEHVLKGLAGRIDVLLDGGPTPGGLESTVLDLSSTQPRMLRPGLVGPAEIEDLIGPVIRLAPATLGAAVPMSSPGQLPRHYAPRAPMECVADGRGRAAELVTTGLRVGRLALQDAGATLAGLSTITMPADPIAYAAELYSALHRLDDLGVERIVVDLPPDTEPWLAIRDRLRRGSVQ